MLQNITQLRSEITISSLMRLYNKMYTAKEIRKEILKNTQLNNCYCINCKANYAWWNKDCVSLYIFLAFQSSFCLNNLLIIFHIVKYFKAITVNYFDFNDWHHLLTSVGQCSTFSLLRWRQFIFELKTSRGKYFISVCHHKIQAFISYAPFWLPCNIKQMISQRDGESQIYVCQWIKV